MAVLLFGGRLDQHGPLAALPLGESGSWVASEEAPHSLTRRTRVRQWPGAKDDDWEHSGKWEGGGGELLREILQGPLSIGLIHYWNPGAS
jgi:hypothetical protein